jgi:hypothetical protein
MFCCVRTACTAKNRATMTWRLIPKIGIDEIPV